MSDEERRLEASRRFLNEETITLKVIARSFGFVMQGSDMERELRELLVAKAMEEGPAL